MVIVAIVCMVAGLCYHFYNKGLEEKIIPIQPIQSVTPSNIKAAQINAGTYKSDKDVIEVTKIIEKESNRAPDVQYVTYTQKEADNQAQQLAKKNKSDYILKETKSDANMINNNFYAIKQEKPNRIGVGVAVIHDDIYATAHYQRDRVRVDAYKSITNHSSKKLDGVGASYDLIKF